MAKIDKKNIWDCIVVGSGSAGAACATKLASKGKKVLVLEKTPFMGGRTSSSFNRRLQVPFDNGQHIMMGCYKESIAFLKRIKAYTNVGVFAQEPIAIKGLDSNKKPVEGVLRLPNLPYPFNALVGFLRFKALSFKDRWNLRKVAKALKKSSSDSLKRQSVAFWLKSLDQSKSAVKHFWQPLCLATLNQDIDKAPASQLHCVLKRSFMSKHRQASDVLFFNEALSDLFFKPVKDYIENKKGQCIYKKQVQSFYKNRDSVFEVETEDRTFLAKKLVLATAPDALLSLARQARIKKLIDSLKFITNLKPSPIVTVYIKFKSAKDKAFLSEGFASKQAVRMVGFSGTKTHWYFDKPAFKQESKPSSKEHAKKDYFVSFVSSACDEWVNKKPADIIQDVRQDLKHLYGVDIKPRMDKYYVRKEAKATWVLKNLKYPTRIKEKTFDKDLFLCGDWLDNEFPGTIEAAVRSGHRVAKHVLK